jgi:hypothetical protein
VVYGIVLPTYITPFSHPISSENGNHSDPARLFAPDCSRRRLGCTSSVCKGPANGIYRDGSLYLYHLYYLYHVLATITKNKDFEYNWDILGLWILWESTESTSNHRCHSPMAKNGAFWASHGSSARGDGAISPAQDGEPKLLFPYSKCLVQYSCINSTILALHTFTVLWCVMLPVELPITSKHELGSHIIQKGRVGLHCKAKDLLLVKES